MDKSKELAEPGKLQQWIATIIVNIPVLSYGMMIGWPSPMVPILQSDESPVGSPMSDEEVSWLTGILCLSGLITTPMLGPLSEKLGRKMTGYIIVLPLGLSWFLKIFAYNSSYLLAARFFSGVGGAGVLFLGPLYISEITSKNLRGSLGSLLLFSLNIGILMTFIFGAVLDYHLFNTLSSLVPLLFLGTFTFLPETPIYLIRRNRFNDATRSLIWLRGGNKFVAEKELLLLHDQVKEAKNNGSASFSDLITDRATRRGMIISIGLMIGQQLSGIFIVVSYSTTIFHMAGSSLSPSSASIIIGAIQIFGSYLSTTFMEKLGRRILLLTSTFGTSVCLAIIGLYCQLQTLGYEMSGFSWIPITSLSIFMIVYCLGIGPAPFVVSSEIFKREISSLANSVALLSLWFMSFVVIKSFAPMLNLLGIYGCFFIFAGGSAGTFLFILILIPETKGRTLDSIVAELNGKVNILKEHKSLSISNNQEHLKKDTFAMNQV